MRGVRQLFHKSSKDLFWISITVLGKTFRIFWNFSGTNILTLARTFVEQKIVPFNVLHLSHKRSRTVLKHSSRKF